VPAALVASAGRSECLPSQSDQAHEGIVLHDLSNDSLPSAGVESKRGDIGAGASPSELSEAGGEATPPFPVRWLLAQPPACVLKDGQSRSTRRHDDGMKKYSGKLAFVVYLA
jgi:hypothetical protein